MFEAVGNQGNDAVIDAIFSADFINHVTMGEMHGQEGAKQRAMILSNTEEIRICSA